VNPFVIFLFAALVAALGFVLFNLVRALSIAILVGRVPKLRLETRQKTVLLLALVWTFLYVVFLFFWLPQNTFYRLFYLPALILLFGLLLAAKPHRISRTLAAFVVALALANFLFLIYPFSLYVGPP
jgi:hypothetical protein